MSKQVAETLEKARALMNSGGKHWMKGDYRGTKKRGGDTCYCAIGALCAVLEVSPDTIDVHDFGSECIIKLVDALPPKADRKQGSATDCVITYNDAPNRRWKHIDALFRRAIKLALDADSAAV